MTTHKIEENTKVIVYPEDGELPTFYTVFSGVK
ncbi:hypothetical protein OKW21_004264 [Catalinimonas alkaloidigena]|nr:hypothetical protein [Catalinimonas alkaloidigena]